MSWNYRIMRHTMEATGYEYFAMHEVYYDNDGTITGWTANQESCYGDTIDELIECLEMMLSDAKKYRDDVLDYPETEDDHG